MKKLNSYKTLK